MAQPSRLREHWEHRAPQEPHLRAERERVSHFHGRVGRVGHVGHQIGHHADHHVGHQNGHHVALHAREQTTALWQAIKERRARVRVAGRQAVCGRPVFASPRASR